MAKPSANMPLMPGLDLGIAKRQLGQPLLHLPLPFSDWTAPSLADLPQDWNAFSHIGFDTETKDPLLRKLGPGPRRGGHVVGVSIAFKGYRSYYLPVRHAGGGNMDIAAVFKYLRDNAATFRGTLVGANIGYDLDYCANEDIYFPQVAWIRDVLIADPLIYELHKGHRPYSLEAVGMRRIGKGKNEDGLFKAAQSFNAKLKEGANVKDMIWALPAKYVGPYAEEDAALPLEILEAQEKIIAEEELGRAWDLESQVLPVLVRMRRRGVAVDEDRLDEVETWFREEETKALAAVKHVTGIDIGVGNTMQAELCAKALQQQGIDVPKGSKGFSVTAPWLDSPEIKGNAVAAYIRRARRFSNLQTTFCAGVRSHITHGRIHGSYNQLLAERDNEDGTKGAITGRMSADHPNMTNQPNPEKAPDIAGPWRTIYKPDFGVWASRDYSTQEPRWTVTWAVYSGVKRIGHIAHESALQFARKYNEDPATDFHGMTTACSLGYSVDDVAEAKLKYGEKDFKNRRGKSKIIGLARIYGAGGKKIAQQLGLPTDYKEISRNGAKIWIEVAGPEAQGVLDKFDNGVPFAKKMLDADSKQAADYGFIRTWSGRKLHFEKDAEGNYLWTYTALNKRIQGSAADQTKIAMVEMDKAGHYLQVQVHDDIAGSEESAESALAGAKIMCECVTMKVPSKVDTKIGPSWGEVKEI